MILKKNLYFVLTIIVFVLQVVFEGIMFWTIYSSGLLPALYMIFIACALILLLALSFFLLFFKMKTAETKGQVVKRILTLVLVAVIAFVSIFISTVFVKVSNTVNNVSNADTEETNVNNTSVVAVMGVYVMDDDPAEEITDAANYIFSITSQINEEYTETAINDISSICNTEIQTIDYTTITESVAALYYGDCGALILNEVYASMLEDAEDYTDFESETRLLYEIEITEEKETSESTMTVVVEDITTTPFVIYISGSDTRDDMLTTSRSDVNIIMVVNPNTKQILLLNTPRDYYVQNSAGNWEYDKLTHCGLYGVDCSMETLENLYGIEINYYAQINFTGFETLVDAIGGVTVTLDSGFTSHGYTFVEGDNELDGAQALALARTRYAFSDGDNGRGRMQMKLITAIIEKITTEGISLLSSYSDILDSLENTFETSFTNDDISTLVKMQLADMPEWDISSFSVTGETGYDTTYSAPGMNLSVMYQNEELVIQASALVEKVLNGETLTDEDLEYTS